MTRPSRKTVLGFPGMSREKYLEYRAALLKEETKPAPKPRKFEEAAQRVTPHWSKYL